MRSVFGVVLLLMPACMAINLVNQPGSFGTEVVETVVDMIRSNCIFSQDKLLLRRLAYFETRDGSLPKTYGNPNYHGGIWQVSESMFDDTQNEPILTPYYNIIRDSLHINWNSVVWSELRKPLYSGLAAALYINLRINGSASSIPLKIEEQGTFLRDHYDRGSSPYNYTSLVEELNIGCHTSSRQVDLVFLIDSSSSLSENDFKRVKNFLIDTIKGFSVSSYATRVAVVTFSSTVTVQFHLTTYTSRVAVNTAINNIKYTSGATNTAGAINTAINDVLSPAHGGRNNAAKVVVLITDGKSDDSINTQQAAEIAHGRGVALFTVGVGHRIDSSELQGIATPPTCTHSFTANGYESIANLRQEIQHSVCRAPLYANTTVTCQLGECPPYAFPFTGNSGLTIEGNVTCGSATIYADINNFYPSTSHNLFSQLIGRNGSAHYEAKPDLNAKFMYVTIQPMRGYEGCNVTLTPLVGNQIVTGVEVICREMPSGHERPCKKADLLRYQSLICTGGTTLQNPCNKEDAQKQTKYPYPGDNTRYIQCLFNGLFQIVYCPTGNVFDANCRICYGASAPLVNCQIGYNGTTPCTAEHLLNKHFYFEYPGDHHKYIQCDIWGKAWTRDCKPGDLWVQEHLTCETPGTSLNPCAMMTITGERFYPYPPDPTKFIECVDPLNPQVLSCRQGQIWADCEKTCELPQQYTCKGLVGNNNYITTTPRPFFFTKSPGQSGATNIITIGAPFTYPCTRQHLQNNQLYFAVQGNKHEYLQCDLTGIGYIRTCPSENPFFNPNSDTCVDGPVVIPIDHVIGKK